MSGPPPPPPPPSRVDSSIEQRLKSKVKTGYLDEEFKSKVNPVEEINESLATSLVSEGIPAQEYDKSNWVQCGRCQKLVEPSFLRAHMELHSSEILPWLYLGGDINASNYEELTIRTGINVILNCARETGNFYPEELEYHNLYMEDNANQDLKQLLPQTNALLDEIEASGRKILVHCSQGISRSSSIVLGYLLHKGWILLDAFDYVRSRRPVIKPNAHFMYELLDIEFELHGIRSLNPLDYWCQCQLPPELKPMCTCKMKK